MLLYLFFGWCVYFFLHSALADPQVKETVYNTFPWMERWYRLIYSIIAFDGLALLLWVSLLNPVRVWEYAGWEWFPAVVLIAMGGTVMYRCARSFDLLVFMGIRMKEKKNPLSNSGLITTGMYRYVRHPLYTGTILFAIGWFLLYPIWSFVVFMVCMFIYLPIGMYFEEKKLVHEFGEEYRKYRKRVKKLIPGVY